MILINVAGDMQLSGSTNFSEEVQQSQESCHSEYIDTGRAYVKKQLRGTKNILTDNLMSTLDCCKVSYRNAVRLIASIAESLGHDITDIILNKSSFNRSRTLFREKKAKNVKILFGTLEVKAAIIHWDGKLIPDSVTCKQMDRLPIIISSGTTEKILNVPALPNSHGITQAEAVFQAIHEWGLTNSIEALCCDTTNSNLGRHKGAAIILEQRLEKDLLYLPCRHHILELPVVAIFKLKLSGTIGPNVPLFIKFQKCWNDIDKSSFKSGLEGNSLNIELLNEVKNVDDHIKKLLDDIMPRDDYKELLMLCRLFLGTVPKNKAIFYRPGAHHHARWMSKGIYSLKIYLFREVFDLTPEEKDGLLDVCLYIVFIHIRFWYSANLATRAPNDDLSLIKALLKYKTVDENLAETALKKIVNHLWYLSGESCSMSFFDDNVSIEVKQKMVRAMKNNIVSEDDDYDFPKKYTLNKIIEITEFKDRELDFFINASSWKFFKRFGINTDFFDIDIELWPENENYDKGLQIVKNLKVVNDIAERAVKLTQDYINVLTKNEKQKQYLVQVIEEYRKEFPETTKESFTKKLKTT